MKTMPYKLCFITLLLTAVMGRLAIAQNFQADDTKMVITSMAVSGDNIFAGTTKNGVYRSTDSGKNWTPVNEGLGAHEYVLKLAVHEKNVYAVMLSSRALYTSNDNGGTWNKVAVASSNPHVTGMATLRTRYLLPPPTGFTSRQTGPNGNRWPVLRIKMYSL